MKKRKIINFLENNILRMSKGLKFRKTYINSIFGGKVLAYDVVCSNVKIGKILNKKDVYPHEKSAWIAIFVNSREKEYVYLSFKYLKEAKEFFKEYFDCNSFTFNFEKIFKDIKEGKLKKVQGTYSMYR